jgi:uncharacterized phage protein (TIGR02218 family)
VTVDIIESSAHDGAPQRLFLFSVGNLNYGYVENAREVSYNNIPYSSIALIDMDDIAQALSEDSPTIEIRIDSKAPLVEQFIPYQPTTPMRVRVYRHHVEDPDDEYITELIGEVASAALDEETGDGVLSVRMLASSFDRKVPWPAYQKQCNYVLYGPGCQVDREAYKTETILTGVSANRITSPDFVNTDPLWFALGYVVRVIDGQVRWVIWQDADVLVLQSPFVGAQGGDEVIAYPGCDLRKITCETKYDNLDRHLGFPWGPQKNPFTDNIMGTGTPGGGAGGSVGGNSTANFNSGQS